ncbi:MAG: CRISPR system precrRNA processing endoribonuclease RAMP protein Cas6 [Desulfobacterota bacterium]|nr:CRISPR system precrRNA processing endoribonuclease RAMP protein Cas6 [Thermodesulfobacteriota bacterium]
MIERLYFSLYRFTFRPNFAIRFFGQWKGSVLRGAFGSSLRRLACLNRDQETCDACSMQERCAYTLIFNPIDAGKIKRLKNLPRGFVIKPPLDGATEYTSATPLRFEMVLVGDRIRGLPYVIVPFKELGRFGIGLNRGRFSLDGIEVLRGGRYDSIYDPETNVVSNFEAQIRGEDLLKRSEKFRGDRLTLRFLTPTRVRYNPTGRKGESRLVRDPEFHHLVRRLRDRINALSVSYCGGPLEVDFSGLAERATKVMKVHSNLEWVGMRRRSRTQETYHDQSGFIGEMTFEGDLEEFLPLLLAGEYLHVGEDAVFGNGWYEIGEQITSRFLQTPRSF